jgi:hypothetical protein
VSPARRQPLWATAGQRQRLNRRDRRSQRTAQGWTGSGGPLAQWTEQRTSILGVAGSNPAGRIRKTPGNGGFALSGRTAPRAGWQPRGQRERFRHSSLTGRRVTPNVRLCGFASQIPQLLAAGLCSLRATGFPCALAAKLAYSRCAIRRPSPEQERRDVELHLKVWRAMYLGLPGWLFKGNRGGHTCSHFTDRSSRRFACMSDGLLECHRPSLLPRLRPCRIGRRPARGWQEVLVHGPSNS